MIHFTKYSDIKFDILNKHKVFYTREQIEEVINIPDKIEKHGKFYFATKDEVKVIYKKDGEIIKIITFYPIKN